MAMIQHLTTNLTAQGKKLISVKILKTFNRTPFIKTLIEEYAKLNFNEDFKFYLKVNANVYDFVITQIPEQYVVNRELVGQHNSDSDCYKANYMIPKESQNCYE